VFISHSECRIEDRIRACCSQNPETKEKKRIQINGQRYLACPDFKKDGSCKIYPAGSESDARPRDCAKFECGKIVYGLDPSSTLDDVMLP